MIQKAKKPTPRIEFLEGIRGYLAIWVMLGHFLLFLAVSSIIPISVPYFVRCTIDYLKIGSTPVALFMILSGFVISLLINTKKEPYLVYITRRFLRLFPAFFFCLLLGFLISPWQFDLINLPWGHDGWVYHQSDLAIVHQQHWIANIIAHIFMLHGLIPSNVITDATGAFLGVGWSISTEWQFYLIAPLGLWLARKKLGIAGISFIIILLSPYFSFINYFKIFHNESNSLILFHLQYFFIGCLSYAAWNQWHLFSASESSLNFKECKGLIILGAAAAFCITDPIIAIWTFIFLCLCQITANPNSTEARCVLSTVCSKPSLFLGKISYSVYLAHWPLAIIALKLINHFFNLNFTSLISWFLFVISFLIITSLVTICISYLLYTVIEKPAIDWGRQCFKPISIRVN